MFATGSQGVVPAGYQVSVLDSSGNNQISSNDTIIVTDAQGQTVSQSRLSGDDIYALRFRESMINNVESAGKGWDFDPGLQLVKIRDAAVNPPENRLYTDKYGWQQQETVLERNQFWEVVNRGGQRFMLARTSDNQGNAIRPSDALNDLFNHPERYSVDCATPMAIFNLKATLETIGEDDFNRNVGQITLSGWYDQQDGNYDGGFIGKVRTAQAGTITVNGVSNLAGETALFDPAKGDTLIPGNSYYFDKPGDNTSDEQGWNAIYLGLNDQGQHRFWSSSVGVVNLNFKPDSWQPSSGFSNYYLGAAIANPNIDRLQSWDMDGSVRA
ncbi:MAG: hypothetical protein KDI15_05905 [Thiothrix sp.]|nr:hypothetical protein [Thiothrix sp.]